MSDFSRDVLPTLRRLYRDVWAYDIPKADVRRVEASDGAETYGEIQPAAGARLLESLDLGPRDVFYDLGSGAGRLVIQAGLGTRVGRAVGVELSRVRHELACAVLRTAHGEGLRVAPCEFRNSNLMRARIRDASVIYCCNTAFPDPFVNRLANRIGRLREGVRFVSLVELHEHPRLEPVETLRLDMSWHSRTPVHVYRVRRRLRGRR